MTDLEALRALRDKVKAGEIAGRIPPAECGLSLGAACNAMDAYYGSLDAALALHEAVLPGWFWAVSQNIHHGHFYARVTPPADLPDFGSSHDTPARALLIAILEALIWKAEQ